MEELNFRVLHVPDKNVLSADDYEAYKQRYANELKTHLQSSSMMEEVIINVFRIKKSEDEGFPLIEEMIFEVRAKRSSQWNNLSHHFYFSKLLGSWNNLLFPTPIVILHENSSFLTTRTACHKAVKCNDVAFGVLPHDGTFHQYASLNSRIGSSVDFFHDTCSMNITCSNHELRLNYNSIRNIFVNTNSSVSINSPCEIFLDLRNPPLFFDLIPKWNRAGELYFLNKLTTKLPFDIDIFGRSNIIRLSIPDCIILEEIISMIHFKNAEKPIHYAHIVSVHKQKPTNIQLSLPTFNCTYLLTAIFKRNFTLACQTLDIFKDISEISKHCHENGDCLEKALELVLAAVDSGKVVNYWHAIESQYHYYKNNKNEINFKHYVAPQNCSLIRRVTLTPFRQLLWPPEFMFDNRVLRNYNSDYALRVSFRDDNHSKLSFHAAKADESIFHFSIRQPMLQGIYIGERHYQFLAWSNSQIRDHGVWMYARDEYGKTVKHIRKWMGDFSHIHSVPKYMARMGQCFSKTEDSVGVPLDDIYVKTEEDIEGGFDLSNYKRYCFSDGIGKISARLSKEVHEKLGHDKLCSAFQIRYGGYKGVLVTDPTLEDIDIVFRDSMKKFNSPLNTRLEIAKTSSPIKLQLNRQLITILNDLGVRHRTFLKLQEEMLKTLTDILIDEQKAAAFLHSKTPNQLFDYEDISKSGIYLTTEPFFRALLLALHRHYVERIKTRANIAIDHDKGRNMLGVLDETGSLKYGEVFVQYTKDLSCGETTRDTVILERIVVVTKNPCLLPGDVRKLKAVNIPQLHHIVDCIVFPQTGWRPHPNEMAGSDLDGDEYAVLWHDDLIFHRNNAEPGDFPNAQELYKEDSITESDMIDFLITFIKNDQLGIMANAHLAHADASSIFSNNCLNLAKKFSYAVDFAKTGILKELTNTDQPTEYPNFMENNFKKTYKSKKALGKMFNVIRDYESENNNASITYNIQMDKNLEYPGWQNYKDSALKSRNKYNTLLRTILRTYGIENEAEIFSGAFTKLHCRFQVRSDREEIEKIVVHCIKRLTKCFHEEFLEEFSILSKANNIDVSILQKASAWYMVTYSDNNTKFLSFPWTVSKYLSLIKVQKVSINPLYISPVVEEMDKQIKICESRNLLPIAKEYENIKQYYDFICDADAVFLALRVLLLWAQDEEIIVKPGQNTASFLFPTVFVKLFLFIARSAKYIVQKGNVLPVTQNNKFSAASLCLEFFKFCLTLRFFNKNEVKEVIPFPVFKYSKLSKKAVVSYHMFAVTSRFRNIYFDLKGTENKIEMNPIQINSDAFINVPINADQLKKAEEALLKYSQVEQVMIREIRQTKKVIVSAIGSEQSLKELKNILKKKTEDLKVLFSKGVLPEPIETIE